MPFQWNMPGVLEGFNLRLAVVAAGRFEEQVVVVLGIERRVEIDEVNGFVRKVLAEDLEIVAVIELVHLPRASMREKFGSVNSAFAYFAWFAVHLIRPAATFSPSDAEKELFCGTFSRRRPIASANTGLISVTPSA
jgi:hypothetical protein